jgi:3',5'-cyclic AMP phosphodiesterase CpdA
MLIAQITDLHAGDPSAGLDPPLDTLAAVRAAVRHLNALRPRPALVMITGDLVADERSPACYEALAATLQDLQFPFHVLPGNHDDRAFIRRVFTPLGAMPAEDGDFLHYALDQGDLRLIALDTHDPGREGGLLCAARLAWLERRLASAPDRPTLLFMHHPPVAIGIEKFDAIGLANGGDLGAIVARNPQIQAIACGHVHRDIAAAWCGALVVVTPSTGYQYALGLSQGADLTRVAEPPACRLFRWRADAGLVAHLSYIAG